MKQTRQKSNKTTRHMLLLPVFLVAVVALILVAAAPELWAHGKKEKVELDEAEVFIEYNSTDGDFGIHFFWDGDPWRWMTVKNERRRPVLSVWTNKNVGAQGLTEGFFESAEPTLDELSFLDFLARFPEGDYTFRGRTLEREWLVGEAEFTHDIPCPLNPEDIEVNWNPDAPTLSVEWDEVETVVRTDVIIPSPPALPRCIAGPEDLIVGYEVVFELVVLVGEGDDEEEQVFKETTTLPAGATMLTASPEFTRLAVRAANAARNSEEVRAELKVEIIAKEASGNSTITEVEVDWEEE